MKRTLKESVNYENSIRADVLNFEFKEIATFEGCFPLCFMHKFITIVEHVQFLITIMEER